MSDRKTLRRQIQRYQADAAKAQVPWARGESC